MPKSPGDRIGRYVIDRRLGAGAMAEAYLAHQEGLGGFNKPVVLKLLHGFLARDENAFAALSREAKVGARLNHVNIVQLFDFGEIDGETFIAMEFVDGLTLQQAMRRCWRNGDGVPVDVAVRIASAAATGLEHAHTQASVVHRDISPDNIMIAKDGTVKLLDFGVAKLTGADATKSGDAKGKVPFMAPEQLRGDPVDARTDVWSLGVTLYWCLAGKRPFQGENELGTMRSILEDDPPPLRARCPAASPELESLVRAMLARDPNKRVASAAQCAEKLQELVMPARSNPVALFVAKMIALDVESLPRTTGGYAAVKLPEEPSADLTQVKPMPSDSDELDPVLDTTPGMRAAASIAAPNTGSGVFAQQVDDDTASIRDLENAGPTVVDTAMLVKPDLSASDDPDITQDDGSTAFVRSPSSSQPLQRAPLIVLAIVAFLTLAALVVGIAVSQDWSSSSSSSSSRSK